MKQIHHYKRTFWGVRGVDSHFTNPQHSVCAHYCLIYRLCLVCQRGRHTEWMEMAIWRWKVMFWGVLGSSKRVQSVAELWMIRDETKWSLVRRQSTEPFSLVFSYSCLLHPFPCSGDDLIRDFIPNSDCWRWLPVDTWPRKNWICPVPGLLSDPGGNLVTPSRNDGIELNHPSSTVLHTAWIPHYKWQFYLLASYGDYRWDW